MAAAPPALSVDLSLGYGRGELIRAVCFDLRSGEALGLVGQSGSGKTTLALSLLGLASDPALRVKGTVKLHGRDLIGSSGPPWREVRGKSMAIIPQSPASALNAVLRIESHFEEAWRAHSRTPWKMQKPRTIAFLASVGLPDGEDLLRRYPDQISVGQAQRMLIAIALLHAPAVLIADEPTSSLDAITQRDVLDLLGRIRDERATAILFISHDLLATAAVADRIAVLHQGEIVECDEARRVLTAPQHPYTQELVSALTRLTQNL